MGMQLDAIKSQKGAAARYIEEEIVHTIKSFGKRRPGSEGETKAVEYMAEKLKEYGCDEVTVEPFDVHTGAFMGWIYFSITAMLAAFGLYFVGARWSQIAAACLLAVGIALFLGEFLLYFKFIDPLYPKKTSHNVTAVKKTTGEVKHRIFYNGHPDVANEFTFSYHFGFKVYATHFLGSLVGLGYFAVILITQITGLLPPKTVLLLGYIGCVFVPFWVGMYFMSNPKRPVDGANDNLTACYMGIALIKELKEQGIELEHTEVGVLITGSEEEGLRGAKAWAAAHKDEYQDVDTYFYCYDTIREKEYFSVNLKDLNGLVKADQEAGDMFLAAAKKVGVKFSKGLVPFGGGATDSAALCQGGFKAVGITGMNHNLERYYHTRKDSYDNLDLEALADCFAVSTQLLEDLENR
ncbi:MAG: M20/M25/M40 family metallo-hydrolase [Oscillospiraceae bacterium]|jgi:hypothetical protein|nr:M20/M25/M40 family metallo-hydrolase [Oscillospiraceae bacterium]